MLMGNRSSLIPIFLNSCRKFMKIFSFKLDTFANMFMKTGERKKNPYLMFIFYFDLLCCIMHWVYKVFNFLTHLTDLTISQMVVLTKLMSLLSTFQ